MKLKLYKNLQLKLSLPWTLQGEKLSGNHQILLPGKKFPLYAKLTRSLFSRVSCINSLTSLTVLL